MILGFFLETVLIVGAGFLIFASDIDRSMKGIEIISSKGSDISATQLARVINITSGYTDGIDVHFQTDTGRSFVVNHPIKYLSDLQIKKDDIIRVRNDWNNFKIIDNNVDVSYKYLPVEKKEFSVDISYGHVATCTSMKTLFNKPTTSGILGQVRNATIDSKKYQFFNLRGEADGIWYRVKGNKLKSGDKVNISYLEYYDGNLRIIRKIVSN